MLRRNLASVHRFSALKQYSNTPCRVTPRLSLCSSIRNGAIRTYALGQEKTTIAQDAATEKFVFPARLLVYHPGVTQTVFIGCSKLSTLFLFAFAAIFLAPSLYYTSDEPDWKSVAAVIGGAIPMTVVGLSASSYVAYVHVRLPPAARRSREALQRWARYMPAATEVDLTTMRFIGTSRITRTTLGRLEAKTPGRLLDLSNVRIRPEPTAAEAGKAAATVAASASAATKTSTRWAGGKGPTRFLVQPSRKGAREPQVWLEFCRKVGLVKAPTA